MRSFIALAVNRPIGTLMCFIAFLVFGLVAASDLAVEFLPPVQVPKLAVSASYPGLPPAQIKELLAVPLEDALSSVKGVRDIISVSRQGLCALELEFHWGTDMSLAAVEAREAVDLAYPSLPSEAKKPTVLPINPGEEPLVWIGVFPKSGDLALARRLAERELKTRLQQADGVGSIQVLGGEREEIRINVDLSKSLGRGVTLDAIAQALTLENFDFPAGSFQEGETEFLVKTDGRFSSETDLEGLILGRTEQGNQVRLSEVAVVSRETRERTSLFQLNGREGVALLIRRKGGENPIKTAEGIRKEVDSLTRSYGKDLDFFIAKDSSRIIASSISGLLVDGLLGAAIAFIVLLIFIRRIALSLILIATIPVSTVITLLLLKISGCSLNTMSLGGLAMGVGMIVDNSVVVLENLERRLMSGGSVTPSLVIDHATEMAGSTIGSTLTSLVVFLPILFLPGLVGALFKDLALSIAFAQIMSFLVSVTLVPVLFLLTRRVRVHRERKVPTADAFRRAETLYRGMLRVSLRRPLLFLLAVAGIFSIGVFLFFRLRYEFMPPVDTGEVKVTAALPPGTPIEYLSRLSAALAEETRREDYLETTIIRAGGESDDPHYLADPAETPEKIHMLLTLREGRVSAFGALNRLRESLKIKNAEMNFSLPDDIIAPLLGVRDSGPTLIVKGEDQDDAMRRAVRLKDDIGKSGLFTALTVIPQKNKPGINLYPNREILLRNNLSLLAVSNTLRGYLDGLYPAKLNQAGREIDIRVRLREEDRSNLDQLARIELPMQSGRVRLSDCVALREEKDFSSLIRKEKKDAVYLQLTPRLDHEAEAADFLQKTVITRGAAESLIQSAFEKNLPRILLVFALSVFLLYLVLGAQFESFTLPLFLMAALPLSFSGIAIALFTFGKSVNLSSSLGVLVLFGVAVNNSIILFENYRTKLKTGFSALRAVYFGSAERLKAIAITVLTTVTALLPVAVDPTNKSSQSPMAVAILGGLTLSTFLTLFVTPLIFHAYLRRKAR